MTKEKDLKEEMKHLEGELQTLKRQLQSIGAGKTANINVKEMNVRCLKIAI